MMRSWTHIAASPVGALGCPGGFVCERRASTPFHHAPRHPAASVYTRSALISSLLTATSAAAGIRVGHYSGVQV